LFTFPTAHGSGLYLKLDVGGSGRVEGTPRIYGAGTNELLAPLSQAAISGDLPAHEVRDVSANERVHFWPAAGLVAVLPTSNKEIQLHAVKTAEVLKQSNKPYLVFASEPPSIARRGVLWTYKPEFWTRN